ncbi:MAG: hypothetical protein WC115_01580 [Sphaerochaeta sp.]
MFEANKGLLRRVWAYSSVTRKDGVTERTRRRRLLAEVEGADGVM